MSSKLLIREGLNEWKEGRMLNAVKLLRKAVNTDPSSEEAHIQLGNLYLDLKKYRKAELEFKQALMINHNSIKGRYFLGMSYMLQDKESQALNEWYKNIEVAPNHTPTLLSLGDFYFTRNYTEKAKNLYSKALSIEPDQWEAKLKLGRTLYRMGRKKEAKALWKEVSKATKDNIEAQYMLAETYVQIFETKEAVKAFKNLLQQETNEKNKSDLKDMILAFSNFVGEKRTILSVTKYLSKQFPNNPETLSSYINALIDNNNLKEAMNIAERLEKINPAIGIFYKGLIHKNAGNTKQAIKMMESAYSQGYKEAEVVGEIGKVWFEYGEYQKAIKYLEEAADLDPFNQNVMWHLALSYQQIGSLDNAIERWFDILTMDPEDVFAQGNMAICYLYKGEYDTAVELIQKAEMIYANDPLILFLRGILYLLEGEPNLTLRKWKKSWNEDPNILDNYWPVVRDLVPSALLGILKVSVSKSRYVSAFKDKVMSIFSID